MKKILVGGLALAFTILLAVSPAMSYTLITFSGDSTDGYDPYGHPYRLLQSDDIPWEEPVYYVWGMPGYFKGKISWNGPVAATDFHVTFADGWLVEETSMQPDGTTSETRFTVDPFNSYDNLWARTVSSETVEFVADSGTDILDIGKDFFFNIRFLNPDSGTLNPNTFAFTASWTATAVPEPTSMLLLASGLVGLAGFRRKFRKK